MPLLLGLVSSTWSLRWEADAPAAWVAESHMVSVMGGRCPCYLGWLVAHGLYDGRQMLMLLGLVSRTWCQ